MTHPHALILLIGMALTGLLAPAPADAHAALRHEGSFPPVFTLRDSAGKPISLQSYLGPRRIVLLFAPSQRYLDTIAAEHAQLEERDLTVLAVVPHDSIMATGLHAGPTHILVDADGRVGQEYGVESGRSAFYLIGKDGHIAVARHGYPTTQELFGVIDAMPMRRQEMRDRHHP